MTEQEAFDIVAENLERQGGPSLLKGSRFCTMWGDGDRHCAIYWLAPTASTLTLAERTLLNQGLSIQFITALRKAHDDAANNVYNDADWRMFWRAKMRIIADRYKLDAAKVGV